MTTIASVNSGDAFRFVAPWQNFRRCSTEFEPSAIESSLAGDRSANAIPHVAGISHTSSDFGLALH